MTFSATCLRVAASIFLLTAVLGCTKSAEEKTPVLHPVTGTITREGRPLGPNGQVTFSDAGNQLTITAVTDAEGKFKLGTVISAKGTRKDGAPEGTYSVSIMPPLDDKQGGSEMVIKLPQKVVVKPGANDFKLEAPPARKK